MVAAHLGGVAGQQVGGSDRQGDVEDGAAETAHEIEELAEQRAERRGQGVGAAAGHAETLAGQRLCPTRSGEGITLRGNGGGGVRGGEVGIGARHVTEQE